MASTNHLPTPSRRPHVPFLAFNQDYTCFACGTTTGFRIFSSDPFQMTLRRDFDGWNTTADQPAKGGAFMIEMLFKSNIVAFIGADTLSTYPRNKVVLWDDHQRKSMGELIFGSEVRGVRLTRDRVVVILEYNIYVYNFVGLKLLNQLQTLANPKGLCAISRTSTSCVLACPGIHHGGVRLQLFSEKKERFIQAHTSSIACLSLCRKGSLLATASEKGTLIRIFNTTDGTKIREFRRGADKAVIYGLAFSSDSYSVVVSSNKNTIHVFTLKPQRSTHEGSREVNGFHLNSNVLERLGSSISSGFQLARSSLLSLGHFDSTDSSSFIKGMVPKYLNSEWSLAQFHLPEEAYAIAAFGAKENTIIVVCSNGSYYKCKFDPVHGGEMVQEQYVNFLRPEENL